MKSWSRIVLKAQRILAGTYKYFINSFIFINCNYLPNTLLVPLPCRAVLSHDNEQCAMISGTNILAADPLSPVNYEEGTPQMVDWIEIWIIWRPSQHLKLIVERLKHSWTISALSQWAVSCWEGQWPSGNIVSMKGWTWIAMVFW